MPNVSLVDGHIDGKQTNYDRIRNMSVEEMAKYFCAKIVCNMCPCPKLCRENSKGCKQVFIKWLESEVDTE